MTTFPKGKIVDTTDIQPGALMHTEFAFYKVVSICGFTSKLTLVCENTIIIWVFSTASKWAPVRIIYFILTILKS